MLALLRKEVMALEQRPRDVRLTLDSDAWLKGVESEMHSIVSNLMSNAVKYTPREGEIELRWWTDDEGGAHLSVRDTGVGIARRTHSAPDRAFLSRRFRPLARHGRLGSRARDRASMRCSVTTAR